MTIKQLSVFLENKPGRLAGMMKALADAGVNIVTLSLANAPEFGIVRVIADDHVKGVEALTKAGFAARETEVVAVTVPDRPGGMAELTAKLDENGVLLANVELQKERLMNDGISESWWRMMCQTYSIPVL